MTTALKEQITHISDQFWVNYRQLVKTEMIPYQWGVLNDQLDIDIQKERNYDAIPSEKSHAIENFKIAAGFKEGSHYGWVFQDSDVYKWLEAVAYSLASMPDSELEELADSVVDLIGAAQEEDGYLCTYFTIEEPQRRYKKLAESHELYSAGHFIEAAVAYYEVTGKEKALGIATKLADHLDQTFGKKSGQIAGYDGHEEIELALVKLYEVTGEERYWQLAEFFLYERGTDTTFFDRQTAEDPGTRTVVPGMEGRTLEYYQAHQPVTDQKDAVGHSVRLVYMCTAMADVARMNRDPKMINACNTLWESIVNKRMYITGGIGSTVDGEAFTADYDLPNDTMYCETCASIGLIFFAFNMLKLEKNARYVNVMERALYNTVLSGMALDGKHFFYVNPLEVVPEKSAKDPHKSHVKVTRPEWFGCACCPPNLARLITSLEKYIYLHEGATTYANLFITSDTLYSGNGDNWQLQQEADITDQGRIRYIVKSTLKTAHTLAIRIPDWSGEINFRLDGKPVTPDIDKGYAYFEKNWAAETILELEMVLPIQKIYGNPLISDCYGKVALQRGPFVYCLEAADNAYGPLHLIELDTTKELSHGKHLELKTQKISGSGRYLKGNCTETPLYTSEKVGQKEACPLTFIPYYAWANRGENEMRVWVTETCQG